MQMSFVRLLSWVYGEQTDGMAVHVGGFLQLFPLELIFLTGGYSLWATPKALISRNDLSIGAQRCACLLRENASCL